ncbi:FecCD family ABC transporter permease [Rudaeicoccus suwonensis]|uniref:Iron complex transport system permease protein n=1 Tax=Rudaeicoccus suwonensis TaxID=657409 RepID=A0A561E831_9MICO|nr:iron ABC transporter permease [Rudaeicoccus suwonensis]TWE11775.1 iron complex transport system permease protein [Rudaeicoccus suwonensis]
MTARRRPHWLWPVSIGFLVVAVLVSSVVGAADLNPWDTTVALLDRLPGVDLHSGLSSLDQDVLVQIRLPRIALGALVGGLLAIAGAGYQGVFRNPLVDSGLLGASAGAGLGATLAVVYAGGPGGIAVPLAAFVGSLTGVALAAVAGRASGPGAASLLLAGLAVSLFLTAVQTLVLQRSSQDIQQVYTWLLGSLSAASWQQMWQILPYAAISTVLILLHGRQLDVLSVGDDEAASLGVHPGRVRMAVIAACALAAASAVAVSGLIGFVGIVAPHIVRRLGGESYRVVLPLSFIIGAGFLVLADTVSRTILSPAELPIGVVTSVIGAPIFLWVLRSTRAGRS